MSYIKVEDKRLDTRGVYLWIEDYAGSSVVVPDFKPDRDYKVQIRLKINGKITKKVYKFPASKTLYKAVEDVSGKRLGLIQEYKDRGTLRPEKIEETPESDTFKAQWDAYIKDIKITARPGTIYNFESSYKTWFTPWAHKREITLKDAQDLVHRMLEKGRSANTIRNVLAPLKTFIDIPWKKVRVPDLPEKRSFEWPIEDSIKLVAGMRNYTFTPHTHYKNDRSKSPQMRAIFEFLLRGRRINEVLTLKHSDLDPEKGLYTIRGENSKGKITERYTLDEDLLTIIPEGSSYIFDVSRPTVMRHFKLLLKTLELPVIHLHDIRHMTATVSLESGVDIADVSRMLGHKKISTTEDRYVTKTTKMAKRATDGFLNAVKGGHDALL